MKPLKTERIENGNLMVSVAVSLNWRGNGNGRRFITPDGTVVDASRDAFLAAVARGRRRCLMDEGAVTSIRDIGQRIGREPLRGSDHPSVQPRPRKSSSMSSPMDAPWACRPTVHGKHCPNCGQIRLNS